MVKIVVPTFGSLDTMDVIAAKLRKIVLTYINTLNAQLICWNKFCIFDNQDNQVKMETVLLQINNNKAYKLIEDLEALDIVKVLKKSSQSKEKLSARFTGSLNLSDDEYNNFQDSLTQSRNEWERDI